MSLRSKFVCNNYDFAERLFAILLLIIVKNITTIGSNTIDTHRLAKRMDLESCLAQFDIHRNTIIRTEESMAIGGKYLQGLELETLEECQRLCCETEGCDVYVFEEKSEGYCYLFECGPPENFHCKFTRHANYTSAVLTPVRHLPNPTTARPIPHVPSINISQQERELTSLKIKPDKERTTTTSTAAPAVDVQLGNGIVVATPRTKSAPLNTTSSCGRFQFTCHSGECIAVYNACDGIPQCEDGSDEGPECSGASSSSANSKSSGNRESALPPQMNSVQSNSIMAVPKITQPQIQPNMPKQYQTIVSPPVLNNREDPMSAPSIWPNRKIQTDIQNDVERNSRIFSHKGGLQLPANNVQQYPQNPNAMYGPMQRGMYVQPDMQNVYRNPLIQPQDHIILPPNVNWAQPQAQQQPMLQDGSYILNINGQNIPQQMQKQLQPASGSDAATNTIVVPQVVAAQKAAKLPVPVDELDAKPKIEEIDKDESEDSDDEEDATDTPKKKHRKHKKVKDSDSDKASVKKDKDLHEAHDAPVHEQYKMIQEHLEMEFRDHDGLSDRPGGAVLSLTLGMIVTAALAILVGCRMRVVGRRRRHGKMPYAHDADFLVNGMYL